MDIKDILNILNNKNLTNEQNLASLLPLLMNMQKDKPKQSKNFDDKVNFTIKKLFD